MLDGTDVGKLGAQPPQRQHGLPELRAVPVPDRRRERRLRHEVQVGAEVRARHAGWRRRSSWSSCPGTRSDAPTSSRAASNSASRWRGRWCCVRRFCCSTSRLGALDAKLRRTLQVELGALQKQVGITFLYVTHDQEEALTMSDRLAVMNHGRIAQLGTPEEVYNEPDDAYVADFLGVSNLMDAQVEPGRERARTLSSTPGRFHARGAGGQARRHRRGQARDPPGAHPPAPARDRRCQPCAGDGRAARLPRLDHARLRPPRHRLGAPGASAQRRGPRSPTARERPSASAYRPTRCACCPIRASAWPRSTTRRLASSCWT